MTPQLDSKRLQELTSQALERSPDERRAFLREALGDNASALREAMEILDRLDQSSSLSSTFPGGSETSLVGPPMRSGPLLPDQVLGGYRIVGRLGAGGMGEVYKARDVELQRLVALKVLQPDLTDTPEALSRFRREARLLASFNHPNIATIHGFEEDGGIAFLVMELVEGWTLGDRLKQGPVPSAETLEISRQIASALEAAHRRGVVHRDLKPSNVMVTSEGWVKVLDFGIAKALGAEAMAEHTETLSSGSVASFITADETITQGLMGTAPYLSPEQLRQEKVDRRSDIWAFGCVVFETLTGKKPFHGRTRIDTYSAILEREPPWRLLPDDLPSAARRLLAQCLQKQPEQRLSSMKEALEILEQALEATPTPVAQAFVAAPSDPAVGAGSETSPTTLGYLDSLGSYTVVERIAAGSQGELYRAWDRERKCDVALKVLRPELLSDEESRTALEREAQALSWLRHPHIAAIYDFGSVAGIDFLVTEFVSGTTLAARLVDEALPGPMVARLGAQIASALAEAHEHGILHRDLKTSNVMLSLDGQAKLIDFGLADLGRIRSNVSPRPKTPWGDDSLHHRAPEVLSGEAPSKASDLYSLGVLLYKMATGRRPWEGETPEALSEAITNAPPPAPRKLQPTLTPELDRLILTCLAVDPKDRPASPQALAEELATLSPPHTLTGNHFTKVPSQTAVALPEPSRRRPWTGLAVAMGLVLAVASGWWLRRDGSLPTAPPPVEQRNPLTELESLVVMPGRLLSELDQSYLADAIPSVISGGLSQLEGLSAKLPPSSFDVERLGGDLWRIADAYTVDAVVLPTLAQEGDLLVLAIQLVETGSRDLLWSSELRGDPGAPSDLARRAAEQLRAALRPDASAIDPVGADPRIERLQQEGLYFAGLYRGQGQDEDKARAKAAFERILELDPDHAPAAAELAVLHTTSLDLGTSILEVLPEIRSAADRAIALDPRNARAWAVLGYVEGGRQPESLRRKLEYALKAATYDPNDAYPCTRLVAPLANLSFTLALASSERATSIDPLILTSQVFEAISLAALGRPEEAIGRISQVLVLEPEMPIALIARGLLLSRSGYEQEALELLRSRLDPLVEEGKVHPAWVDLARQLARFAKASRQGDTATADAAAKALVAMGRGEAPFPRWEVMTVELAAQLTRWGRSEEALRLLEYRSEQDLFQPFDYLLFTPDLAPLRSDPRFQVVVEKSRARFDEVLAILEEARNRGELPTFLEEHLADLLKRIRRSQRA